MVGKVYLVKKLSNLKMTEGQSFRESLNQFNEVNDGLTSVFMGFDEEFLAMFMLIQLPESSKMTCQSIANLFGKEKLDFSQVVNMIMTEEIRMCEEGFEACTSLALNMEGRESRNRNQNMNQRGRLKSRGKSQVSGQLFGKSTTKQERCRVLELL